MKIYFKIIICIVVIEKEMYFVKMFIVKEVVIMVYFKFWMSIINCK